MPYRQSQTTHGQRNLGHLGINTAELGCLSVGQVVHGVEAHVEPAAGVVDGENVDRLAVVRGRPARAAVGRVPAGHLIASSYVGEVAHVTLHLPVVLGHDAVSAVRARNKCEAAAGLVVSDIVRDWGRILSACLEGRRKRAEQCE